MKKLMYWNFIKENTYLTPNQIPLTPSDSLDLSFHNWDLFFQPKSCCPQSLGKTLSGLLHLLRKSFVSTLVMGIMCCLCCILFVDFFASFGCNNLAEAYSSYNLKVSHIHLLVLASPSCINVDGQWLSQSSFTTVEVAQVSVQVCACTWILSPCFPYQ